MPTLKLPITGGAYKNLAGEALNDKSSSLINGYVEGVPQDAGRATVRSPGASLAYSLGGLSPVSGMYWWDQLSCAIATAAGGVYKLTYPAMTYTLTDLTSTILTGPGIRPTFAAFLTSGLGPYLFIARGGPILYTDGTTTTAAIADADAPITATHVVVLDGYLICNAASSNRFYWSDLNLPLTWTATSFASAEGNSDYITAIHVHNRELYLFGPSSIEVWENDGETPFSRVAGGFIQSGVIAPYSIIIDENKFYWLNERRHFVSFDGRNVETLSVDFDKELEALSVVSDCVGDRIEISGKTFFVWSFPTANRTFVYDVRADEWAEWGRWNTGRADYDQADIRSYCYSPLWNKHLVGSAISSTSKILELSPTAYDWVGATHRLARRSGHIDFGSLKNKRSNEVRLRIKRGEAGTSSSTGMTVRWKDNGRNVWSNEHLIPTGPLGSTDLVARLQRTGIYRTRQWEISATDAVPIVYADAEEDIEVLR